MKKKILIGSIIAVAILIGVSFTSVVGYSSVKSPTIAETSPLFKVRTDRAIGEESKILTSNYFGRGNTLPFPKRDGKSVMVQKVVDTIREMDEETLEKFIATFIKFLQMHNKFNGENPDEIKEAFHLVRDSDKPLPILDVGTENKLRTTPKTICLCEKTVGHGLVGLIRCLYLPTLLVLIIILEIITDLIPTLICL